MIFLFFTSPLAPLEAEICPIEVWYGMAVVVVIMANIANLLTLEILVNPLFSV